MKNKSEIIAILEEIEELAGEARYRAEADDESTVDSYANDLATMAVEILNKLDRHPEYFAQVVLRRKEVLSNKT
jgi:hypothetical protein